MPSKYYPKGKEPKSALQMLSEINTTLRRVIDKPNLYGYEPHDKQRAFHESQKFGRLFIGGNQSGKTTSGVVEDIRWATKRHPHRRIPSHTQIAGRAISVDFLEGVDRILVPEFKRWVLPSDLKNGSWLDSWDGYRHMLTFSDGSFIEFLTYEQTLEKHAGTKRHFVHFDEEPPESIFGENMARLMAQENSAWWITMTPTQGITWVNDRFVDNKDGIPKDVDVFRVDSLDNPHLPEGAVERVLGNLDEDERAVRQHGSFVPKGGRVYPEFQASIHATLPDDWKPPLGWTLWMSMDSGWNNPTCILYTAVSPSQEQIVTFHEMYGSGKIVAEWAREMKAFEAAHGLEIYARVGDPAMKQCRELTGTSVLMEYGFNGINIGVDSIPREVSIGVEKIKQYLRPNPKRGNRPFWEIVGGKCPYLVDQMKKLEWEHIQSAKLRDQKNRPETIKKLRDHAPDAARYQFTCFPDLTDAQLKAVVAEPTLGLSYMDTLVEMAETPPDAYRPPRRESTKRGSWEAEYFMEEDGFDE